MKGLEISRNGALDPGGPWSQTALHIEPPSNLSSPVCRETIGVQMTLPRLLLSTATSVVLATSSTAAEFPAYEFERVLDRDAYVEFVESLPQDRIDPESLSVFEQPAWSTRIDEVKPGGQADKAGVKPGWFIGFI